MDDDEYARFLAQYLKDYGEDFLVKGVIHQEELEKLIKEFNDLMC